MGVAGPWKPGALTDTLLAAVTLVYRPVAAVATFAGLRTSEAIALRYCDIDFEEKLIHVRHSLSRGTAKKPATLQRVKTRAGERDVELFPRLESLLREHRRYALAQGRARPEDFVFQTSSGRPLAQANVSGAIRRAVGRSGIDVQARQRLSMHPLRHNFVTRLVGPGLDVVTVSRQAGHSKPSFTLDRYAHEFKQAQTEQRKETRRQVLASGFGA